MSLPHGSYLDGVVERLSEPLGSELHAVVLGGSAALGAYVDAVRAVLAAARL